MKRNAFIRTFGCQMNVRDSEVIAGILRKAGYKITSSEDKADIVIFNTCSVRQHAEEKVWSAVGAVSGKKIIGITGCMAQNYNDEIFRRAPKVDFAAGPSDIDKIPQILKKLENNSIFELKVWETDGGARPEEIYHSGFYSDKEHAFVVISEGCENYCSYCVVPYVRGSLRHRDYKDILREIEEALNNGITKITLLGQNVNSYQYEGVDFIGLIGLVNRVEGLKEFGFVTSHPKDATPELFKAMAGCDKLKKYLHLPVQSGSDSILKAMNRGYTRKYYLDLAAQYRKMVKGGVLTTDIIVGFPGETEEDFEDTRRLVDKIQFQAAYIFKYSPRPHTEAANLYDNVEKREKERRHKIILDLQRKISTGKKC